MGGNPFSKGPLGGTNQEEGAVWVECIPKGEMGCGPRELSPCGNSGLGITIACGRDGSGRASERDGRCEGWVSEG